VYTSGYCVLSNDFSSSSNCSVVNVVRDLRCFLFKGIPGSLSVSESSIEPDRSPSKITK